MDISEHHTEPIPVPVGSAFHSYLARYRLTWMDVARAAGVPYPIKFIEKALRALSALTGEQCTRDTVGGIYAKDDEEGENE